MEDGHDDRPAAPGPVPELTVAQAAVARIWADLLGIEPIEPADRFSELGGTSLLAEQMLIRVRADLGVPGTAGTMTDDPPLVTFVDRVEQERVERFHRRASTTMVVLRDGATTAAPTVLCVAGAGATSVGFLPLTGALAPEMAVVGFQAKGLESRGVPDWTVRSAARRHARSFLGKGQSGPLVVVGHSFGGHIAAELARILTDRGAEVCGVVLLDTILDAGAGRSVAELATGRTEAPPWSQRLRTHARVATAGIVSRDLMTHRDVMWEQAVRVQHRYTPPPPAPGTVVVVTDEHAGQAPRWAAALGADGRVERVPGDHNSVLHDPANVAMVARLVEAMFHNGASTDPDPGRTDGRGVG